jgi:plastocyanin
MPKALAATVVTLSVLLGLTACGSDSKSSSSSTTEKAAAKPPVTLSGTVNNKGTKDISGKGASTSIELEAYNFYFEPTFVKVAPGQKITIELKNSGSVPHTFTSPSLHVDKEVPPGSKATVVVTVPMSGTTAFYCRFHKDNGMQGAFFESS